MRTTRKAFKRSAALQGSQGLNVDEIGGNQHSINPKVRWKRAGDHHRTSRLKHVSMLALSHAILRLEPVQEN
jgi:hypothetical protein